MDRRGRRSLRVGARPSRVRGGVCGANTVILQRKQLSERIGSRRVSLRLGHAHVLTAHRAVIHSARAASLPASWREPSATNGARRGSCGLKNEIFAQNNGTGDAHSRSVIPINALKVFEGVRGNFFQKVPPKNKLSLSMNFNQLFDAF